MKTATVYIFISYQEMQNSKSSLTQMRLMKVNFLRAAFCNLVQIYFLKLPKPLISDENE